MICTKPIAALSLGVALFAGLSVNARAAMNVGDEPKLDFKAADGTPVSLERLKGKIVVVDFWATWCGPCMGEAGHMVELNTKYAPQGMQLIGISLDQDKATMTYLLTKPEVKSSLAKAARAETAKNLLDAAQKLKDAKKDEQAYPQFKALATDYPDTDAGTRAAAVVKAYEQDTAFVKRVNETAGAAKAGSAMKLAKSYASAGRNDLARKKYQEIVDEFPGTSYAEQAQKAMAALPAE